MSHFPPAPVHDPLSLPSTRVILDQTTSRLQYWDVSTRQLIGGMDLGQGNWIKVCIYHVSHEEVYAALITHRRVWNEIIIFDMRTERQIRRIPIFDLRHICMYCPPDAGAALLVGRASYDYIDICDWESGEHLRAIGEGHGSGPGQMNLPGIFVVWTPRSDPADAQLIVADTMNTRLQYFRLSDGAYTRQIQSTPAYLEGEKIIKMGSR
jgi:hypothetical protein